MSSDPVGSSDIGSPGVADPGVADPEVGTPDVGLVGVKVKPRLRGVSHQGAFYVAAVIGPLLTWASPAGTTRLAVALYSVCMIGLFGVSALFHRVTWQPAARRRMRRLDHSMIFLFIAGTYTPVAGLTLGRTQATVVLSLVWAGALTGIIVKLLWLDAPKPVAASLYVGVGWVAVMALPGLWVALGVAGFLLLVGGGVLYTIGAIVYATRRPDPVPAVFGYHEVFHAFVIVAALCHLAVIYFWVVPNV